MYLTHLGTTTKTASCFALYMSLKFFQIDA